MIPELEDIKISKKVKEKFSSIFIAAKLLNYTINISKNLTGTTFHFANESGTMGHNVYFDRQNDNTIEIELDASGADHYELIYADNVKEQIVALNKLEELL